MKKIIHAALFSLIILCFSCGNKGNFTELSPSEFNQSFKDEPSAILIDVRTPDEFAVGKIEGAYNLDINNSNFETQILTLDKSKTIYVYCLSGSRSKQAASLIASKGFKVVAMQKGLLGWRSEGLPISESSIPKKRPTKEVFDELIAGDKLVMVDFFATWCGPCKMMEPDFNRVKQEKGEEIVVMKIDVDQEEELSRRYQIMGVPTLMLFKNNEILYTQSGVHYYEQMIDLIEKNK
jgi:thioredoxin 1